MIRWWRWTKPHRVNKIGVSSTFYWKYISVWVYPKKTHQHSFHFFFFSFYTLLSFSHSILFLFLPFLFIFSSFSTLLYPSYIALISPSSLDFFLTYVSLIFSLDFHWFPPPHHTHKSWIHLLSSPPIFSSVFLDFPYKHFSFLLNNLVFL